MSDEETLSGRRPRGVLAPVAISLAALAASLGTWALSFLREEATGNTVDPAAVALRVIALALTIRSVARLTSALKQLAIYLAAPRYRLRIGARKLTLVADEKVDLAREKIVAIREEGAFGTRSRPSFARVFVTLAGDRPFVEIPPVFEASATALAERLMRWLGPPAPAAFPEPIPASREYDDAAAGRLREGSTAFRHGYGWLKRGPYASLLVGAAFLDSLVRSQGASFGDFRAWIVPIILVALAVVPLGWVAITATILRPRKGLALVVTPARLLLRTERGTIAVPYEAIERVSVHERRSWSIVEGLHWSRALVIERVKETPIRYEESFLGAPIDAVVALLEARRQAFGASVESAPQPAAELAREDGPEHAGEPGDRGSDPD